MWLVLFVIRQESNIDSVCYGVALSLCDDSGMKENQDAEDKRSASDFKGHPLARHV